MKLLALWFWRGFILKMYAKIIQCKVQCTLYRSNTRYSVRYTYLIWLLHFKLEPTLLWNDATIALAAAIKMMVKMWFCITTQLMMTSTHSANINQSYFWILWIVLRSTWMHIDSILGCPVLKSPLSRSWSKTENPIIRTDVTLSWLR